MTDIDDNEKSMQVSSVPDIGARLRKAREARQLTIAEVASQLRLPKEVIEHLEQQDWARLHGRTYAHGYFSSYVKFLQLDYEELLEQFNHSYTEVDRPKITPRLKQQIKDTPGFGIAVKPVIFIAALAGVAWLVFSYQDRIIDFVLTQQKPNLVDYDAADRPVETLEPVPGFSRSVEPIIESQPATLPPIVAEPIELTIPDEWQNNLLQSEVDDGDLSPSIETAESTASELLSPQSPPQLSLTFSGECWVEVIDASSTTLLSRIVRAGEQLSIAGDLPLSVRLGRASAVTVEFNNEPMDIGMYTQGDVARFSVGSGS